MNLIIPKSAKTKKQRMAYITKQVAAIKTKNTMKNTLPGSVNALNSLMDYFTLPNNSSTKTDKQRGTGIAVGGEKGGESSVGSELPLSLSEQTRTEFEKWVEEINAGHEPHKCEEENCPERYGDYDDCNFFGGFRDYGRNNDYDTEYY